MSREEIDPQFPFIQVHRSVGTKAAQLAALLGCTVQHARGSLDTFWEALADRRILAGKPALILGEAEVRRRLHMAFGQPVEPALLEDLGFLEPAEGGYRIRGMSRYINAEAGRVAKKGPRDTGERPALSGPTPVSPRCHPGVTPVGPGYDPDDTGERKEERVKSLKEKEEEEALAGADAPAPAAPASEQPPEVPETAPPPELTVVPVEGSRPPPRGTLQTAWNNGRPPELSEWREMSKPRAAKERVRMSERPMAGPAGWFAVIARIRASRFCLGENARGWRAGPDWLLEPDTAAKVLEGKYDNTPKMKDLRHGRHRAEDSVHPETGPTGEIDIANI